MADGVAIGTIRSTAGGQGLARLRVESVESGTALTSDDTVITPVTSACSSCHDGSVARAHMESNGGSFATTQAAIDSSEVVEQCDLCHKPGGTSDISLVHPVRPVP